MCFLICSGAQVGVASFAVNFMSEQGVGISQSFASQLFSYCQMTFTLGRSVSVCSLFQRFLLNVAFCVRFVGVVLLNFIDPALMLSFYAIACSVFCLGVALASGKAGIGCLFALFFFESICYPVSASLCGSICNDTYLDICRSSSPWPQRVLESTRSVDRA